MWLLIRILLPTVHIQEIYYAMALAQGFQILLWIMCSMVPFWCPQVFDRRMIDMMLSKVVTNSNLLHRRMRKSGKVQRHEFRSKIPWEFLRPLFPSVCTMRVPADFKHQIITKNSLFSKKCSQLVGFSRHCFRHLVVYVHRRRDKHRCP